MSWVKLDDGFYDNPKILAVGLAAAGLYAAALSYAARKLTDGFVPDVAVWMLTSGEEDGNELPKILVNHGLWMVVPGGYQIHDFLEYNPPASKVKADRAAAKERMRSLRSENVRPNKERSSEEVRKMFATPVPVPVPGSEKKNRENRSRSLRSLDATAREENREFNQFWDAYPRHEGKQDAWKAWKNAEHPPIEDMLAALAWQREQPRWLEENRRFVPHPATYLNHRRWEDERPAPLLAGTTSRTAGNMAAIARGLEIATHGRS